MHLAIGYGMFQNQLMMGLGARISYVNIGDPAETLGPFLLEGQVTGVSVSQGLVEFSRFLECHEGIRLRSNLVGDVPDQKLEDVLSRGDDRYGPAPAGLSISLGWGLPYFERYVPETARERLPVDLRASKAAGRRVLALVDAIRFPSDPEELILEQNHVAFFFRSDSRDHISSVSTEIFDKLDQYLCRLTYRWARLSHANKSAF